MKHLERVCSILALSLGPIIHSFILTYFLQDTKHCPYSSKQSASHRAGAQGTVLPGSEDFLGGYTKAERLGESIQLVGEGLKEGKIRGPS